MAATSARRARRSDEGTSRTVLRQPSSATILLDLPEVVRSAGGHRRGPRVGVREALVRHREVVVRDVTHYPAVTFLDLAYICSV
jgi:hypothetical protein